MSDHQQTEHRQVHRPATGDSECSCGEWVGPMTTLDRFDERSFLTHVATIVRDRLASDPRMQDAAQALAYPPDQTDPKEVGRG